MPGPAGQPPFYAIKIVPGDLGTKGGLRTDERARVLRADGSAIPGLYAAGNTSAAVMGHSYAGAGATIGPAMTFGYLAALDLAGASQPVLAFGKRCLFWGGVDAARGAGEVGGAGFNVLCICPVCTASQFPGCRTAARWTRSLLSSCS